MEPIIKREEIVIHPNTLTRVVTGLGIVVPEAAASVTNGVYGVVDHCATSPNIMAANARMKGAVSGATTSVSLKLEMAKAGFSSEEGKAKREAARKKIGLFAKKIGQSANKVAPVKFVVDNGKALVEDAKEFIDSTDRPITIYTETVVHIVECASCGCTETEFNQINASGVCENCSIDR